LLDTSVFEEKFKGCTIAIIGRRPEITPQIETLIHVAEYLTKYGQPVPLDTLTRLLEAGIDIKKFT